MSILYNITLAMHVINRETDVELGGTTSVHMGEPTYFTYIL